MPGVPAPPPVTRGPARTCACTPCGASRAGGLQIRLLRGAAVGGGGAAQATAVPWRWLAHRLKSTKAPCPVTRARPSESNTYGIGGGQQARVIRASAVVACLRGQLRTLSSSAGQFSAARDSCGEPPPRQPLKPASASKGSALAALTNVATPLYARAPAQLLKNVSLWEQGGHGRGGGAGGTVRGRAGALRDAGRGSLTTPARRQGRDRGPGLAWSPAVKPVYVNPASKWEHAAPRCHIRQWSSKGSSSTSTPAGTRCRPAGSPTAPAARCPGAGAPPAGR